MPGSFYRAVAQLSGSGRMRLTETNAYSGNNGRAAITAEAGGKRLIYTAGNAGNGGNPQPDRGDPRRRDTADHAGSGAGRA